MYNIKTLRGTIFCPPIRYSKEFVAALYEVANEYVPVIVRDNGALPVLPIWQLTSSDEREQILFNGEKIDLIQRVEHDIDDDAIRAFAERCTVVVSKVLEVADVVCTRIALAPSVIITEKGTRPSALYNKLFSINSFEDVQLDTSNLSQVYRVNKTIGEKEVKINYVSNFRLENELVNLNGINQMRERYMGDFDINTMVNPEYKFSIDDVKGFFNLSPTMFVSFYNLYFGE